MDKAAAKTILCAYRPGREDVTDPVFTEALHAVEQDAELAAWLEEEQRFDASVIAAVGQTPVPADLKGLILLNARAGRPFPAADETRRKWRPPVTVWLAAASLMLAFFLGRQTFPRTISPRASGGMGAGTQRLALQAVAYTEKMPALQFVCFDASMVAKWVSEKSTAMQMGTLLDKSVPSMQMIGSSATRWEGRPVMMIALQNGDQMAMLYVVNAADFPEAAADADAVLEHDGWAAKTGRSGGHLYVLTARGTRDSLRFPMPL